MNCTETKVIEGGVEYIVREYENGHREWRTNAKLKRVKLNCVNGPAIVYAIGDRELWLFGKEVIEAEHAEMVKGAL